MARKRWEWERLEGALFNALIRAANEIAGALTGKGTGGYRRVPADALLRSMGVVIEGPGEYTDWNGEALGHG